MALIPLAQYHYTVTVGVVASEVAMPPLELDVEEVEEANPPTAVASASGFDVPAARQDVVSSTLYAGTRAHQRSDRKSVV